jgi:hypothetical protein
MSSDKPSKKHSRVPLVIVGCIILFFVIGFLIPTLTPSGADNYTGVKQKAAQVALEEDSSIAQHVYNRWTTQHIVKMELTPPNTRNGGITCPTDPNLYYSYIVTIQRVSFLGIPVHEAVVSNCRAA